MHAHDIGMFQSRQATCLPQEMACDGFKLRDLFAGAGDDLAIFAKADGVGEAFLDDNPPFQAVAGEVGDAKPAAHQIPLDHILTVQQRRSRQKLFCDLVVVVQCLVVHACALALLSFGRHR